MDVCPVDCIHELARMLVVDPEECIDCNACEPECPVEAIFPDQVLPESWHEFVPINAAWNESASAAGGLVERYVSSHQLPLIEGWRAYR